MPFANRRRVVTIQCVYMRLARLMYVTKASRLYANNGGKSAIRYISITWLTTKWNEVAKAGIIGIDLYRILRKRSLFWAFYFLWSLFKQKALRSEFQLSVGTSKMSLVKKNFIKLTSINNMNWRYKLAYKMPHTK